MVRIERRNRAQDLGLLVADGLGVGAGWWLHGQEPNDLQQVILDHVPHDAGLFVELSTSCDAERFGHRDLDVLHVVPVPDGFEKGVGEAEIEDILHRLLAQVVVDAKDAMLVKLLVQHIVERAGGRQIAPERFFHHHPGATGAPGVAQTVHDRRKERWRNGQIVQGASRRA